jgi:hypothetical protein
VVVRRRRERRSAFQSRKSEKRVSHEREASKRPHRREKLFLREPKITLGMKAIAAFVESLWFSCAAKMPSRRRRSSSSSSSIRAMAAAIETSFESFRIFREVSRNADRSSEVILARTHQRRRP